SSILIKSDQELGLSESAVISDLGINSGMSSYVTDEIEILKSRTLMRKVVKELGLNVEYISKGYLRTKELYNNAPVRIHVLHDSLLNQTSASFVIFIHNKNEFSFVQDEEILKEVHDFGKWIETTKGSVKIQAMPNVQSFVQRNLTINIRSIEPTVSSYQYQVSIFFPSKLSRIIQLNMTSSNREKAKDILNNLIKQYQQDALDDKRQISNNTELFIQERIALLDDELFSKEKEIENYKKNNNLTDIQAESGLYLSNRFGSDSKKIEIETELQLVDYMADYVERDSLKLIPSKIGITDPVTNELISKYNELSLRKQKMLESVGPLNPQLVDINNELSVILSRLRLSLQNLDASLRIQLADINEQSRGFRGNLAAIPTQEREFRDISREQQVKESLYLYLLQKREETAIAMAATASNIKVIDPAYASLGPVLPDKNSIYTKWIIISLILPFVVIFVKDLLDTKVRGSKEIENRLNKPILGEIPKNKFKTQYVVLENDKSNIAESFRLLDTNLEFLLA
ncbi:MAG: GNVR domain-containing protein, partial [Flavobacteriaceae bacterium]|nr:GNVR domain-containing protein [Flavobacteriaceae bacterium]